jgi:hypothetical protein
MAKLDKPKKASKTKGVALRDVARKLESKRMETRRRTAPEGFAR